MKTQTGAGRRCTSCRNDLQKTSESVDFLETFKVRVETSSTSFTTVVGDGDTDWMDYGGGVQEKEVTGGVRNTTLVRLDEFLKQVVHDVGKMIEIRSMKFFYMKELGYLRNVTEVTYSGSWMTYVFHNFQDTCRKLIDDFNTVKGEERSLVGWRTRLSETSGEFAGLIYTYGPDCVGRRTVDDQSYLDMKTESERCLKVTRESLCILNPGERKYQIWYTLGDREQFLKDIGFPGVHHARMGEMVEMWGLLDELKRMSVILQIEHFYTDLYV